MLVHDEALYNTCHANHLHKSPVNELFSKHFLWKKVRRKEYVRKINEGVNSPNKLYINAFIFILRKLITASNITWYASHVNVHKVSWKSGRYKQAHVLRSSDALEEFLDLLELEFCSFELERYRYIYLILISCFNLDNLHIIFLLIYKIDAR